MSRARPGGAVLDTGARCGYRIGPVAGGGAGQSLSPRTMSSPEP